MRRRQDSHTQPFVPVSEDTNTGEASPGLRPSDGTKLGTELNFRAALSHTQSSKCSEWSAEGTAEQVGAANRTASVILAWPPDLFGQVELVANVPPQKGPDSRGRLVTTFDRGESTDTMAPPVGDAAGLGNPTTGETNHLGMLSTARTSPSDFDGGYVRSGAAPEQSGCQYDMQASGIADVAAWLAAMESVIRLAFPAKLALFVTVGEGIGPIAIDRHKLSAVLFELAMNARDAMAGVGTVAIGARNMAADEPRKTGVPAGENVVISIRSNRAGMSGDLLMWIPETFFEDTDIDRWAGGTIPMAGAFMEASGGAIVVRSVLEKITAVDVILPRADRGRDQPCGTLDRTVATARDIRILVVDDDEVARGLAVECLEYLGYTVVTAATAESAYTTVMSSMNIDLVISVVVMPDIGGVTLAGMLRTFQPDLPVVFMTGYPLDFILLEEMVLTKPFTVGDLEVLVVRGLDRRRYRH